MFDENRALALLRTGGGTPNAAFTEGQEDAIRHIVQGAGRLLVVQNTGWAKASPTLLISPLLWLMRN
jgi:ATP-dependent DNA helicase RecQ